MIWFPQEKSPASMASSIKMITTRFRMSRIFNKGSSLLRKIGHLMITDSNQAWHAKMAGCGGRNQFYSGYYPKDEIET